MFAAAPAADRARVSVVGSVNIDLTVRVEGLPVPGQTVVGGKTVRSLGGKGANQAVALAHLLGSCRMVGAVGDDPEGAWALASLAGREVDTRAMRTVAGESTGAAYIAIDAAGENTIIVSAGANEHVEADEAIEDAAVVLSLEIGIAAAMHAARRAGGLVVLNASPAMNLPAELVARADVIIVNETEFDRMPEIAAARSVVRTEGARGATIFELGVAVHHVPALRIENVVSSVGAGDSFCGGLTAALVSGFSLAEATGIATAVAAAALGSSEAQPHLQRLDAYVAQTRADVR